MPQKHVERIVHALCQLTGSKVGAEAKSCVTVMVTNLFRWKQVASDAAVGFQMLIVAQMLRPDFTEPEHVNDELLMNMVEVFRHHHMEYMQIRAKEFATKHGLPMPNELTRENAIPSLLKLLAAMGTDDCDCPDCTERRRLAKEQQPTNGRRPRGVMIPIPVPGGKMIALQMG